MSLSKDEIAVIEQEAARLEKWADEVSFSYSPTVVRLSPSYGTSKMILSLLKEMPAVGEKFQKDYNMLDEFFADACKQFRKPMTTEGGAEERQFAANTATGCARQIAKELRHIARIAKSEEQAANVERGDHTSIDKHGQTEKKKGNIRKVLAIIAAVVGFLAALLTCLHYLGWL